METTQTKEKIRKYEMMAIVDAKLTTDQKETIFKEILDAVKKFGGKVINSQVWMEKHKLTFEIKKVKEGTYYLINFESDGSQNAKLRDALKLNEKVLRFAITASE